MDRIFVRDLEVEAHVGVTEEERSKPQKLVVQLELLVDTSAAGSSDDLNDTVDYGQVSIEAADEIRGSSARLLEHLADKVVTRVARNLRVVGVTVEIAKVDPPIPETLGSVGVRVERSFER
ncbi:MAG: 7,8-dihydroneopterin aldolase/epimerase/oxygenase [Actinomycetota bacterium]|jgi:dihydroneopterin aldolase|nr:7,8-dihydroneopterin aldolase/epimerase/oxygenase [Actinomycetota bacterium]